METEKLPMSREDSLAVVGGQMNAKKTINESQGLVGGARGQMEVRGSHQLESQGGS